MKLSTSSILTRLILGLSLALTSLAVHAENLSEKNVEDLIFNESFEFSTDGSVIETVEAKQRANNDLGRTELSLKKISYNQDSQSLRVLNAYSLTKGQKFSVPESSFVKNQGVSVQKGGLSSASELIIPFSNMQVGSEIYIKYQRTRKPNLSDRFSDVVLGIGSQGLANQSEYYHYQSYTPMKYYTQGITRDFEVREKKVGRLYTLDVIPKAHARSLGPKLGKTYLFMVSNYPTWNETFRQTAIEYEKIYQSNPSSPELSKIIEAARKLTTPQQQIEYISNEISKIITYSGTWTTTSGRYLPKPLQKIFDSKTGDCKDFSLILLYALRKLNFEAYPAVTYRGAPQDLLFRRKELEQVPSVSMFNHMIVWTKDRSGKARWVDPTNAKINADYLMADIKGSPGVVLKTKSREFSFLPDSSEYIDRTYVEKNIQILPDAAVVSGKVQVDPGLNSEFENLESLRGKGFIKKMLGMMIDLGNANLDFNYSKKTEQGQFIYQFNGKVKSPITDKGNKIKILNLANVALMTVGDLKDVGNPVYLGETGDTIYKTTIKSDSLVDPIDGNCYVVSPWLDISRTVNFHNNVVEVVDHVVTKKRFLYFNEPDKKLEYQNYFQALNSCARKSDILLSLNFDDLSGPQKRELVARGPDLNQLNDLILDRILEGANTPSLNNYMNLKAMSYFQKKLDLNPKDMDAKMGIATAIYNLGTVSKTDHLPAFLEKSKALMAEVKKQDPNHEKLLALSTRIAIEEKNESEALENFKAYYAAKKIVPITGLLAIKVSLLKKDNEAIEKWLKISESLSLTPWQRSEVLEGYADWYEMQGNWDLSLRSAEESLTKDISNAWRWHSVASRYYRAKNWVKAIEYDTKALSFGEFLAAKVGLSSAYLQQANLEFNALHTTRSPADVESKKYERLEESILKSVKLDLNNKAALTFMFKVFKERYQQTKDKRYILVTKALMQEGLKKSPEDSNFQKMISELDFIEKGKRN